MSTRKNMSTGKNMPNGAKKPYCKVCHDSGKSEAEYTSHYVKSEPGPKGKIICPTLLSQSCSFCKKTGHTVKFCLDLQKRNKTIERNNRRNEYKNATDNLVRMEEGRTRNVGGAFGILDMDEKVSKSKHVKAVKEVEMFPALSSVPTQSKRHTPCSASYADMASKPKQLAMTSIVIPKHEKENTNCNYECKPATEYVVDSDVENFDYSDDEDEEMFSSNNATRRPWSEYTDDEQSDDDDVDDEYVRAPTAAKIYPVNIVDESW